MSIGDVRGKDVHMGTASGAMAARRRAYASLGGAHPLAVQRAGALQGRSADGASLELAAQESLTWLRRRSTVRRNPVASSEGVGRRGGTAIDGGLFELYGPSVQRGSQNAHTFRHEKWSFVTTATFGLAAGGNAVQRFAQAHSKGVWRHGAGIDRAERVNGRRARGARSARQSCNSAVRLIFGRCIPPRFHFCARAATRGRDEQRKKSRPHRGSQASARHWGSKKSVAMRRIENG
jgi:hypothetical protein